MQGFFPPPKPPKNSVGLVSCGKRKRSTPSPAKLLYTSGLFRASYRAAVAENETVFILSAKYGLVLPDQFLKPYDLALQDLSPQEQQTWAAEVCKKLPPYSNLSIYAGSLYWKLLKHLPNSRQPYTGNLFERMQQLSRRRPT